MGGMERLTKRREYNCACWNGDQDYTTHKRYLVMLDALAAYEDTGLTPDEIAALQSKYDELLSAYNGQVASHGALNDKCAALRAENERLKDRWEETASDNTGYRLTHFDGIYALEGPEGAVICEFIHDTARAALGKEGH